jgi:hypothetical protein
MPQPETPTARATAEESRPVTEPTDLTALRAAARAAVDVPGVEPVRWRVVSIEYGGGIAPVCTATSFTLDADLGGTSHPTHRLDADVFGPDTRDDLGLYDCCPRPWIEVWSEEMAAYLVALLNGDAAVVRPCNCGHDRAQHDNSQCRVCPGDSENTWQHPYTAAVSAPGGEPAAPACRCGAVPVHQMGCDQ